MDHERRCLEDRRIDERRYAPERRGSKFFAFTERETLEISEMFADPHARVECPRCGGRLLLTSPELRDGDTGRDVICTGCRGRVEVPDTGSRQPG